MNWQRVRLTHIPTDTENEVSFNVKRAAHCHAPTKKKKQALSTTTTTTSISPKKAHIALYSSSTWRQWPASAAGAAGRPSGSMSGSPSLRRAACPISTLYVGRCTMRLQLMRLRSRPAADSMRGTHFFSPLVFPLSPLATWKSPLDYIKISASNWSHSPSDRTHRARIVFI